MTEISKPKPIDPLNSHKVGTPMSDDERSNLAKANAAATEEAHRLAAEHRARDAQNEPPLIQTLQGAIKEKLEELPPIEGNESTQE